MISSMLLNIETQEFPGQFHDLPGFFLAVTLNDIKQIGTADGHEEQDALLK